jgi:hypothetical protein
LSKSALALSSIVDGYHKIERLARYTAAKMGFESNHAPYILIDQDFRENEVAGWLRSEGANQREPLESTVGFKQWRGTGENACPAVKVRFNDFEGIIGLRIVAPSLLIVLTQLRRSVGDGELHH